MARIFYTPEISMPHDVKFADCEPNIVTQDNQLAVAYYVGNYLPRSAWYEWQKGPLVPPFLLQGVSTGTTTTYSIYFNAFTGGSCPELDCHVQCTNQNISLVTGGSTGVTTTFCINGERPIYHFDIEYETEGDKLALPAYFNFTFEDSLGNTYTQQVESIMSIKPAQPIVGVVIDDSSKAKAYVSVIPQTAGFTQLNLDNLQQYVIERCDWPSRTNVRIFKGPINSTMRSTLYTDEDISKDQEVAYRVKFLNNFGEESLNSDWTIGGV